MRITNKTRWKTRNLKTFVTQVCYKEMIDQRYINRLHVTFRYQAHSIYKHAHGVAGMRSWWMEISIPKDWKVDKTELAWLIAHELTHCQGLDHRHGNSNRYRQKGNWREIWGWAEALTLEEYAPEVITKPTALQEAEAKLASAKKALSKWQSKKKLATTKVQKYKDKVAYYNKRMEELKCQGANQQ